MSEVFLTDMRTEPGNNILDKFEKLLIKSGLDKIDFKNKFVALKIHFGEPGNLAYIRPNYVHVITEIIKQKGGVLFLPIQILSIQEDGLMLLITLYQLRKTALHIL